MVPDRLPQGRRLVRVPISRLVTGQFDSTTQKAVWPSTGNYCRGGAFNSRLLSCDSIAILPEGMSRERFDWLKTVATEIIATPGSESNVKEIFDKTNELRQDPVNMIFNQFEEMGNTMWHYNVTGYALPILCSRQSAAPATVSPAPASPQARQEPWEPATV
jgi:cysteine synthase